MKKILTIMTLALVATLTQAQDYKVAKSTGKLMITEVGDVRVEGYDGNEIIFTSRSRDRERDERAAGLRAVSSLGLEDNTGLGLSVLQKGEVIEVRQLKKMDGPDITIKVPKGVSVSYEHSSPHGSDFVLKNVEGEVNVSTVHNQVMLDNVTGTVNIKTVHGDIDATFGPNMKNPIILESVHGHVDVGLPIATKASLKLGTSWGEIFVDPELKIEVDTNGGMRRYSDNFTGKMNGGGLNIELSSTHNNIYLRKK
jgi:predicted membrane protein